MTRAATAALLVAALAGCGSGPAPDRATRPDTGVTTERRDRAVATLREGEFLGRLLARLELEPERARQAESALAATGLDFRRLQVGDSVLLEKVGGRPVRLVYRHEPTAFHEVRFHPDGATGARVELPVDTVPAVIGGTVEGSLWRSVLGAGGDAKLVADMTSVLRPVLLRPERAERGDSFAIVVDRLTVDGSPLGFGYIHCLFYRGVEDSAGVWAFFVVRPEGQGFYCDDSGRSLGRLLEYPPVTEGRRTSDFGMRVHPMSRRRRMHDGLDYTAPRGTPVRAVAAGRVGFRRWNGGYGRTVAVDHGNRTSTRYAHLSGYADGIEPGAAVARGQAVGYVGSSGYASGNHLHFEVRQADRPVDPLGVLPSRRAEVSRAERPGFERLKRRWREAIADWSRGLTAEAGRDSIR